MWPLASAAATAAASSEASSCRDGRPTTTELALDDRLDAVPGATREAVDRERGRRLRFARTRRSPAPRDARSHPRPSLRGARAPRGRRRRRRRRRRPPALPSVTVPVLSSTIVVIRRVCSRISGPRIRIPSCAPRPVPTISAVGVARPSAHGQAMISTATAAVNAAETSPVTRSQPPSVASERAITIGTKTAETRSTSRWIGAFPALRIRDETGDLRQGGVATDLRRLDDEPARGVDRGARNRRSLPHLDRHGLARQHRLVDGRGAGDDDAVGCDLLAGTHDEAVADRELGDRHEHLGAPAKNVHVLRAELEQGADRLARATPGARFEVAAEQDQRRDHGGSLEVRLGVEPGEQHDRRPAPGGERPDRDQRVHRRRAVARRPEGGAMERPARPEDDRRRERERDPLPARELQRHHHRDQGDGHAQHGCDDEPQPQRTRLVARRARARTPALPRSPRPRPFRRGRRPTRRSDRSAPRPGRWRG